MELIDDIEKFYHNAPHIYEEFKRIVEGYINDIFEIDQLIIYVTELLSDAPKLIARFYRLLPPGYIDMEIFVKEEDDHDETAMIYSETIQSRLAKAL